MRTVLSLAAALLALAACDRQDDRYPALIPTAEILAEPRLPEHAPDAVTASTAVNAEAEARAAALRRRADALRGPVIEQDIRDRMQQTEPQ